ncbi:Gp37-like protein [Cellulomonas sp. SG140]|uniref:Gp37-like protein n=1 Tax=Cellulomonas sp. SG140 TaxID=2976536 RepID=UPI0021E709EC|nr:hypothetical protein [Cellulomonas sp. SG140]
MDISDITLEVRNKNLGRVGVILPTDATFTLKVVYCNVGEWSITLPLEHPMTAELRKPGAGLIVTGPGGMLLLSGLADESASTASSSAPEGMVTVSGVTDDVRLSDALAWPVPTSDTMAGQAASAHDTRTGPVETLLHAYVNANIGPGAPASRRVAKLVMGTNQGRGPTITKNARFPVLGSWLNEIAATTDLGFRVVQRGSQLVFETFKVVDRSREIRMDIWNNTLASYDVRESGPITTRAIVAGQDEGTDRQFLERTTTESLAQEALWGRRIEKFLDRRNTGVVTELQQAGDEVLAQEGVAQKVVKFVPMDDSTMAYGKDWYLGDRVTAVIEGREITAIAQAVVIVVDDQGLRLQVGLSQTGMATDFTATQPSRIDQRVDYLERNVEIPLDKPPVVVPSGANMNDYITPGDYTVPTANATSIANLPPTKYGNFSVAAAESGTVAIQSFTSARAVNGLAVVETYHRRGVVASKAWGPWHAEGDVTVDSTAMWLDVASKMKPTPATPLTVTLAQYRPPLQRATTDGVSWYIPATGTFAGSPSWQNATLVNGWQNYTGGFASARYIKTSAGIVMLQGLVRKPGANEASSLIMTLPVGYRPTSHTIFGSTSSDSALVTQAARVDVYPDGSVYFVGGASGNWCEWVNLSDIVFPASDVAPDSAWTPFTYLNGFTQYNWNNVTAGYWVDSLGRYWFRGLVGRASSPGADTPFAQLPGAAAPRQQIHVNGMGNAGAFCSQHINNASQYVWKYGGGLNGSFVYFSVSNTCLVPSALAPDSSWYGVPLGGSWVNYDPATFPGASCYVAADGIVHWRGLIRNGGVGGGQPDICAVPTNYRGSMAGTTVHTMNAQERVGRTDFGATALGPIAGVNVWWSLNNIYGFAEG